MGATTSIAWRNHTFNPWWGCMKVGRGCDFCYADADRSLAQQSLGGAAVRVVAIGADDLAFAHRHVRRAIHLRAPVLVALEAGIGLERGLEIELHRHLAHDRVAIGAGKAARLVRAAAPVGAVAALVAGEADGVVLGRRAREIILAERDDAA